MNNLPAVPPSATPEFTPQPPKSSTTTRTILIIAGALVLLCCLCSLMGVGSLGVYQLWRRNSQETVNLEPVTVEETLPVQESTAIDQEEPTAESTPVQEDTASPTAEAPTKQAATEQAATPATMEGQGMGVSRAEMVNFFGSDGAFKFGEPSTIRGLEMVQGTHTWLCVETNCAAVTLGGPQEDLLVIAVSVPTDPQDSAETTTAIALLMTTAARFADKLDSATLPAQILTEITDAQSNGKSLENQIENNGYLFITTYDPNTHNAGLAIMRPK